MIKFKEIWKVFSTGHGDIEGLDAISLSEVFRIAEMELMGGFNTDSMRKSFLKYEPGAINRTIRPKLLDKLIKVIKRNTRFDGADRTIVYNADGQRRYENLPDIGFMITNKGPQTVALSDFD